jgi:hypothetical protein
MALLTSQLKEVESCSSLQTNSLALLESEIRFPVRDLTRRSSYEGLKSA